MKFNKFDVPFDTDPIFNDVLTYGFSMTRIEPKDIFKQPPTSMEEKLAKAIEFLSTNWVLTPDPYYTGNHSYKDHGGR